MRDFLAALLLCSAAMTAPLLLYLAISPLLERRYAAKWRYYAWLLLALGLLIPFRPTPRAAVIHVPLPTEHALVFSALPAANPGVVVSDAPQGIPLWTFLFALWAAGAAALLIRQTVRHIRFLRLTARWSAPVTDMQTLALFDAVKSDMRITAPVGLRICDGVGSPALTGVIHPKILLPRVDWTSEELHFILAHELTHYRRRDLLVQCLMLAVAALHWFNPAVYLMARAVNALRERSCDEAVMQGKDEDARRRYSEAILGAARYHARWKTAFATNFYGGKQMKQRIFSIMDTNAKKAGSVVLACVLLLVLATGLTVAAQPEEAPEESGVFLEEPAPPEGAPEEPALPEDGDSTGEDGGEDIPLPPADETPPPEGAPDEIPPEEMPGETALDTISGKLSVEPPDSGIVLTLWRDGDVKAESDVRVPILISFDEYAKFGLTTEKEYFCYNGERIDGILCIAPIRFPSDQGGEDWGEISLTIRSGDYDYDSEDAPVFYLRAEYDADGTLTGLTELP